MIFGLGYVAGTRDGRERYDRTQQPARTITGPLRSRLEEMHDSSHGSVALAARKAWDDSDIKLGGT